jgi:hypothetical protein
MRNSRFPLCKSLEHVAAYFSSGKRLHAYRYMAVAEPGLRTLKEEDIRAFKVPHGKFIKLHEGTWHAGPHFLGVQYMDFYNLELADTNQVDHTNHNFDMDNNSILEILPC